MSGFCLFFFIFARMEYTDRELKKWFASVARAQVHLRKLEDTPFASVVAWKYKIPPVLLKRASSGTRKIRRSTVPAPKRKKK